MYPQNVSTLVCLNQVILTLYKIWGDENEWKYQVLNEQCGFHIDYITYEEKLFCEVQEV